MSSNPKIKTGAVSADAARLAERLLRHDGEETGTVIYSGRNRIIRLTAPEGGDVAVKYFSRSLKNRLVYALFSSKARRSYLHALELLRRGVATPRPIAWAERRGALHTLQDSLYICEFREAADLRDYLASGPDAWKEFARFAASLHTKGILHRDLNNTNVRVEPGADGAPAFSLIDLNRIKFLPPGTEPPLKEAARNLVRFSYLTPEFELFAREYVRARGLPPDAVDVIMEAKRRHEKK